MMGDEKMFIRKATHQDLSRIAEIYVYNNRKNYWPIFKDDKFSFKELQVVSLIDQYFGKKEVLEQIFVYDDDIVKGFIEIKVTEIKKIYVDTFFQSQGIGENLIQYAVKEYGVNHLWALEKNKKAISFYERHGFLTTNEKQFEEGTTEYLIHLIRTL
jgi:Acetyltransferases